MGKQKAEGTKPVTVRVAELKTDLNGVVAKSGLPPFILEMILGEYLSGVSMVARKEYAQDQAQWESEQKEGESHG